jgi:hypothetical protein
LAKTGEAISGDTDPRRIAVCLAACEGISTEALEDGIILKLIAACLHVNDPRIREVLQVLSAAARPKPLPPQE